MGASRLFVWKKIVLGTGLAEFFFGSHEIPGPVIGVLPKSRGKTRVGTSWRQNVWTPFAFCQNPGVAKRKFRLEGKTHTMSYTFCHNPGAQNKGVLLKHKQTRLTHRLEPKWLRIGNSIFIWRGYACVVHILIFFQWNGQRLIECETSLSRLSLFWPVQF